jgi:Flp pilus assembly protein TadG
VPIVGIVRKTSTISDVYFFTVFLAPGFCNMSFCLNLRHATADALRRFPRDNSGSNAIQFALIAAPFFAMIFAIIEMAMIFFATQAMETATQDAARLIMTGQAQMQSMSGTTFKTQLCNKLMGVMDCANGLDVDVKSYSSFANVSISNPVSGGTYNNTTGYDAGHAGDIVVVRTFYQWPVFVTGLGFDPSNIGGNKRLITATAAFRNEPGPF